MDMVDFDPIEESEEDYNLEDFFPKPLPYPIHHLVEYRIKILLKNNTVFTPGETQVVNTSCMLKGKIRVAMSMHLIPFENLPLGFESGGYISQKYSGRVVIKLTNYSTHTVKLNSGTPVGYIVMQPFSLN
jgi:dUTPase